MTIITNKHFGKIEKKTLQMNTVVNDLLTLQDAAKKVDPKVFCHFLSNRLGF